MGCKDCMHMFKDSMSDPQCDLMPHDYETAEQKAIVKWLQVPGRHAWEDNGCPSWQHWKKARRV